MAGVIDGKRDVIETEIQPARPIMRGLNGTSLAFLVAGSIVRLDMYARVSFHGKAEEAKRIYIRGCGRSQVPHQTNHHRHIATATSVATRGLVRQGNSEEKTGQFSQLIEPSCV